MSPALPLVRISPTKSANRASLSWLPGKRNAIETLSASGPTTFLMIGAVIGASFSKVY